MLRTSRVCVPSLHKSHFQPGLVKFDTVPHPAWPPYTYDPALPLAQVASGSHSLPTRSTERCCSGKPVQVKELEFLNLSRSKHRLVQFVQARAARLSLVQSGLRAVETETSVFNPRPSQVKNQLLLLRTRLWRSQLKLQGKLSVGRTVARLRESKTGSVGQA